MEAGSLFYEAFQIVLGHENFKVFIINSEVQIPNQYSIVKPTCYLIEGGCQGIILQSVMIT